MRKLVVGTFVTLDGVIQAPGALTRTPGWLPGRRLEVGEETLIFDSDAAHK